MSVTVNFTRRDGTVLSVEAGEGESLLTVAQNAGLPLEGTCEGQMACSTCHVYVAREWFEKLEPPREEEEDMLDLAAAARANSRLSCQIELTAELDGIAITIPPASYDQSR